MISGETPKMMVEITIPTTPTESQRNVVRTWEQIGGPGDESLSGVIKVLEGMTGSDELLELINSKGRRVYVTERPIDLRNISETNTVFVLQLPDGSTAAGGRGGGFGERRIVKVHHFQYGNGECLRLPEVEDDERLDSLELPYHATAMAVILPDGKEKLVSGVVDPAFVSSYRQVVA